MSLMTSSIMSSSIFLAEAAKPMRRALSHITLMRRGIPPEFAQSKDHGAVA